MKHLSLALVLCVASASCLAQSTPDQNNIKSIRTASNQAIAVGNITAFASSLEDDFIVVTGNGSLLARDAYIAAFAKDFQDPHSVRFERMVDAIDLSHSLPLAAEHGHWVGRIPGGPVLFSGTYLAMWRKSAGGWMLRSELFVSLECKDTAACESYRKRYASPAAAPQQ